MISRFGELSLLVEAGVSGTFFATPGAAKDSALEKTRHGLARRNPMILFLLPIATIYQPNRCECVKTSANRAKRHQEITSIEA
jgi:hypothetical protein